MGSLRFAPEPLGGTSSTSLNNLLAISGAGRHQHEVAGVPKVTTPGSRIGPRFWPASLIHGCQGWQGTAPYAVTLREVGDVSCSRRERVSPGLNSACLPRRSLGPTGSAEPTGSQRTHRARNVRGARERRGRSPGMAGRTTHRGDGRQSESSAREGSGIAPCARPRPIPCGCTFRNCRVTKLGLDCRHFLADPLPAGGLKQPSLYNS